MFPTGPNPDLTPGSLCDKPDAKRYPEGIPYCNRDVGSGLKHEVIGDYDRELGFHIASMQRTDFKIDHYFPLCMGGSNKADNLWPQHKSVYAVTDPLEPLICQKMADGKLLQKDAVQYVIRAKAHLNEVPSIIQKIQSL
jgi:hypothetical protein